MTSSTTFSMSTLLVAGLATWLAATSVPAHDPEARFTPSAAREQALRSCPAESLTLPAYVSAVGAAIRSFDDPRAVDAYPSCSARE